MVLVSVTGPDVVLPSFVTVMLKTTFSPTDADSGDTLVDTTRSGAGTGPTCATSRYAVGSVLPGGVYGPAVKVRPVREGRFLTAKSPSNPRVAVKMSKMSPSAGPN